jgi:hypothetical protein
VDDGDRDTESAEQDADTRIRTSEEQPEQGWKLAKDFSTKGSSAKFNSDRCFHTGRQTVPRASLGKAFR